MKKAVFLLLILIGISTLSAQPNTFFFATRQCRDSVTKQLKQQIHQTIQLPLNERTYQQWMAAYWAMEIMLYKPAFYEEQIVLQLTQLPQMGPGFQRAFFEMLYTLYPGRFDTQVQAIVKELKSEKVKAMALEYLALSGKSVVIEPGDPFLSSTYYRLYQYQRSKKDRELPFIKAFLDTSFLKGITVLCSFQSTNRNNPGYLMIRLPNGEWMKNENGEELKFPQLARSISNLPFYLTNGNTPEGLYRITGVDTSHNNWIGPTSNLQMILPFEGEATNFFGESTSYETYYRQLLGERLKKYNTLWESYWAGKLGRTEIIAHGTAIDPQYYQSQPYYPNTPSLGCLCSPELWSETGELLYSAQQSWMQFILSKKINPSWLIVAEVADL